MSAQLRPLCIRRLFSDARLTAPLLSHQIVIEGHDAMHFGLGQVQAFGDDGQGVARHIAIGMLNGMQEMAEKFRAGGGEIEVKV